MRFPRRPFLLLLATALVLAACGDDDAGSSGTEQSADAGSQTVTIYSGRTQNLISPILDEFAATTGIDVRVRYGQSADLALLLEEEAAAEQVQADVFLSQSPGSMGFLEANGRLGQLPASVLDLVPSGVRDDDDRWVGFSGRQRVLVYNEDLVDEAELPDSVFDLTDDAWRGRIGVAPANGSFQDFVTSMRATDGDDTTAAWLAALADNDVVTYPNNNAIVAAVGRGEVDAGLVNHYYNFRFLAENEEHPGRNHQFAADDPGSILIVTGAAVLDGREGNEAAIRLIEFLLGESGQRYFADETFEYPLATGIEPSAEIPPISFGDVGSIDYGSLGTDLASTRALIADAGLDG